MAVCVVCLLCAEHLPCKQHFEDSLQDPTKFVPNNDYANIPNYIDRIQMPDTEEPYNIQTQHITMPNTRRGRTKRNHIGNELNSPSDSVHRRNRRHITEDSDNSVRSKRHGGHDHHSHDDDEKMVDTLPAHAFVQKIFQKFGNVDSLTMNVFGFEKMLKDLGLYELLDEKLSATPMENIQPTNDTVSRGKYANPKVLLLKIIFILFSVFPPLTLFRAYHLYPQYPLRYHSDFKVAARIKANPRIYYPMASQPPQMTRKHRQYH